MNRLAAIAPSEILQKVVDSPCPFAMWRLPHSSESTALISLQQPKQTTTPLSELPAGFLFNRFEDSHPIAPFFFPADILIEGQNLNVHPSVSGQAIDQLLEDLAQPAANPIGGVSKSSVENQAATFTDIVTEAVNAIREGRFEKVVLARHQDMLLPEGFSPLRFFEEICANYPAAFCSMVHLPGKGLWFCATPELLLSDNGHHFRTVALAGTKPMKEDEQLSDIAWTQKEIEEQALVSRYIINCFKKLRLREFEEHGPKTVQAGHLAHLKTEFTVDLKVTQFERLAEQMLELLHPTSAVCGMPLEEARAFIKNREGMDRSFYSGFLGPVSIHGRTSLFVNLRTLRVHDGTIRFYAGAGITGDSQPEKELLETDMKMGILKRFII